VTKPVPAPSLALAAVLLVAALPAVGQKLGGDFRSEFERTFSPGHTWVVLLRDGIPTTSVYGTSGTSDNAHFSIDVRDGEWTESKGLLDLDQTAADELARGEILELDSISYKDARVDLRFVSIEVHKVMRHDGVTDTMRREAVATNFKFFLPFRGGQAITARDVPQALACTGAFVKPFARLRDARLFAAGLLLGRDDRRPVAGAAEERRTGADGAPPARRPGSGTSREIRIGMSRQEVQALLGPPLDEMTIENTTRWKYADLTVVFEHDRVRDVLF
jgi:hypothetical protein